MCRTSAAGIRHLVVARLRGAGSVDLGTNELAVGTTGAWALVLTSEDAAFSPSPAPVTVMGSEHAPVLRFAGPAAVIFRAPVLPVSIQAPIAQSVLYPEAELRFGSNQSSA